MKTRSQLRIFIEGILINECPKFCNIFLRLLAILMASSSFEEHYQSRYIFLPENRFNLDHR